MSIYQLFSTRCPPLAECSPTRDLHLWWHDIFRSTEMEGSWNRGTTKSSILMGFSIVNLPFWGTPIYGNPQIESMEVSWSSGGSPTSSKLFQVPRPKIERTMVTAGATPSFFSKPPDECVMAAMPEMIEGTIHRRYLYLLLTPKCTFAQSANIRIPFKFQRTSV